MSKPQGVVTGWVWLVLAGALHAAPANLIVDAGFESPLPLWFQRSPGALFFADKRVAADAAEGRRVLRLQAWSRRAGPLLSPVVKLPGGPVSACLWTRSRGPAGGELRLALYDAEGRRKLADLLAVELTGDGRWRAARKEAAAAPAGPARVGLRVVGAALDAVVDVDRLGLFPGAALPPGAVRDNDDTHVFEAESLADGKAWERVEHYRNWYRRTPSGLAMLAGFKPVAAKDNRPAIKTLTLRRAGPHRLWLRALSSSYVGGYTLALRQAGRVLAQRAVKETEIRTPGFRGYHWGWIHLDANLAAGPLRIELTRPPRGSSWITRKLDLFVLTNNLDYQPDVEAADFRTPAFLRFRNLSSGQEPFCVFLRIRHHQGPMWYSTPGMLNRAGLVGKFGVPADRALWLRPGDWSPWVRVNRFLRIAGGRNNVACLATRASHVSGLVQGRLRGELEFAVGEPPRAVKRIHIDQEAPRFWFTAPGDPAAHPEQVKTPQEYVAAKQAVLAKLPPAPGPTAKYLDLAARVALTCGLDDPRLINAEVNILKRLGFNTLYYPCCLTGTEALSFYKRFSLKPSFRLHLFLLHYVKNRCQLQPDWPRLRARVAKTAEHYAALLDKPLWVKLMDEPGGMSFAHMTQCPVCQTEFVKDLKRRGLTPADVGARSWSDARLTGPKEKRRRPKLYYYSALFRLRALARLCKTCLAAAHERLPTSVRGYVNYSPPLGGGTWTRRGTDPFFMQRGALTAGWSEDWLGYGAGPMQTAYCLAILRAACRPGRQPIGLYVVGRSGGPVHQRFKFYEALAGGARVLSVYNYGPLYCSIDSWSDRFAIYPVVHAVLHEFGAIDDALHRARRRPSDVALLYNRTASIWEDDVSTERDAQFLYWALRHAGYDPDILPEEDVAAGALKRYRVLYVAGTHLRRDAAARIAAWTRAGGALMGTMGAGARDEFDRPLDALNAVFGVKAARQEFAADAGRPLYEFKRLKPLARLTPTKASGLPPASVAQLCWRERLTPAADAQVVMRFANGSPAALRRRVGRGVAWRFAALPGVAYMRDAARDPAYSERQSPTWHLPRKFDPRVRDLIAAPAAQAGAARVAACDRPLTEFTRYDAPGRAVVFALDYSLEKTDAFTFELPDAAGFKTASSARGRRVQLQPLPGGRLRVTLPLHLADAVVLRK